MEYIYHTYLFERAADQGARVFNRPAPFATTTKDGDPQSTRT